MLASSGVTVHGLDELSRKLKKLPVKMADAIIVKGLKKSSMFVRDQAKMYAPSDTGVLKKSIGYKKVRASRTDNRGEYHVGWRKGAGLAYYGFMQEFGTSGHNIKIVNKKVLADVKRNLIFGTKVHVRGIGATPYMVPALENNQVAVLKIMKREGNAALARMGR